MTSRFYIALTERRVLNAEKEEEKERESLLIVKLHRQRYSCRPRKTLFNNRGFRKSCGMIDWRIMKRERSGRPSPRLVSSGIQSNRSKKVKLHGGEEDTVNL